MRTSTLAFVFAAVLSACAGGADDPATPDAPNPNVPVCGDGTCASSEVGVCSQDCGSSAVPVCGNQMCEAGETTGNCPNDCTQGVPVCGDSTCDMAGGENSTNCPGDCNGGGGGGNCPADPLECFGCLLEPSLCPAGLDPTACEQCILGGGGAPSFCEGGAPDGTCNAGAGEDATTCAADCP